MKKSHLLLLFSPYIILFLGIAFNQAALYANGRLMPVMVPGHVILDYANDANHAPMIYSTHLKFLGDWVISNREVSSIGDFLQTISSDLKMPSIIAFIALTVKDIFKR